MGLFFQNGGRLHSLGELQLKGWEKKDRRSKLAAEGVGGHANNWDWRASRLNRGHGREGTTNRKGEADGRFHQKMDKNTRQLTGKPLFAGGVV